MFDKIKSYFTTVKGDIDAVKGATVTKAANAAQGTKDVVKGVVLPPTRHQGDRGEYGEGYADDDSHPTPDFAWEGGQDVNLRESVLQEMNQHAMSTFSKRMRGAMRGESAFTYDSEMASQFGDTGDAYDGLYDEDDLARNPVKEERFMSHSGYIYVKVKSNILPFMYRRYYCILKKGVPIKAARAAKESGQEVTDAAEDGDYHDTGFSIAYWRSRMACHRLVFNPRCLHILRPCTYTTEITRVRGIKIDLRGGEDYMRSGTDSREDGARSHHHIGRNYLSKSLWAMEGSSILSRFTGLKWFQFRTGKDLHCFTVQIDGETSPFRRRRLYLNQITFASESLERLMKWRKAITESVLALRENHDAQEDDELYGKCHERCLQATFSAMHLMPTTVIFHAIFSKSSKHLQITLPPSFSPIHYFVHAVLCSITYTQCCADELASDNDMYFPRHNVRDWAVIDRGLPAWICDDFLTGWFYDDEFDAPRLGVFYKIIRDSEENQARQFARTYQREEQDSGAGGEVVKDANASADGPTGDSVDSPVNDVSSDAASYLHVVFAIRGTDPSDPEDIRDDLLILRGAFNSSNKRVKWFKRKLKEVKAKYMNIIDTQDAGNMEGLQSLPSSMKVTVTGHSLGGLVAFIVGNDDDTYVLPWYRLTRPPPSSQVSPCQSSFELPYF